MPKRSGSGSSVPASAKPNGANLLTTPTVTSPNTFRSRPGSSIVKQAQRGGSIASGGNTLQSSDVEKAATGSFVAKNRLQAGAGKNGGWQSVLKSALDTLQRGKIPLLLAVEAGNQSMCRELLGQQTADQLKAVTGNGDTALHLASRRKDVDMVRILVDYGTNVDIQNVSLQTL